jgi:hypothetical protein
MGLVCVVYLHDGLGGNNGWRSDNAVLGHDFDNTFVSYRWQSVYHLGMFSCCKI